MAKQDKITFGIAIGNTKSRYFDWYGYSLSELQFDTSNCHKDTIKYNGRSATNITISKNQAGGEVDFIYGSVGENIGDKLNNYTTFMVNNMNLPIFYNENSINQSFPRNNTESKVIEWENSPYIKEILQYKQFANKYNTTLSQSWKNPLVTFSSATLGKYFYKKDNIYLNIKDFKFYNINTNELITSNLAEQNNNYPSNNAFSNLNINDTKQLRRNIENNQYYGTNMHYIVHNASLNEIYNYIYTQLNITDENRVEIKKLNYDSLTDDEKTFLIIRNSVLWDYITDINNRIFTINDIQYKLDLNNSKFIEVETNNSVDYIIIYDDKNNIDYFLLINDLNNIFPYFINNYKKEDEQILQSIQNDTYLLDDITKDYFKKPYTYTNTISDIGYWYDKTKKIIYSEVDFNSYNPNSVNSYPYNLDTNGNLYNRQIAMDNNISSEDIKNNNLIRAKFATFRLSPDDSLKDGSYTNVYNNTIYFYNKNNTAFYTTHNLDETDDIQLIEELDRYKSLYLSQDKIFNNPTNINNNNNNNILNNSYSYYFDELNTIDIQNKNNNETNEDFKYYLLNPILVINNFTQVINSDICNKNLYAEKQIITNTETIENSSLQQDEDGNYYTINITKLEDTYTNKDFEIPIMFFKDKIEIKCSYNIFNLINKYETIDNDTYLVKYKTLDKNGNEYIEFITYNEPFTQIVNKLNKAEDSFTKTLPYLMLGSYYSGLSCGNAVVWGLLSAIGWLFSWIDRKHKDKFMKSLHFLAVNTNNQLWFNNYNKKISKIYYKNLFKTDLNIMDKRQNPNYQDLDYKVNNKKGKLSKLYTDTNNPNYIPPILQVTKNNNPDYSTYINQDGANFLYNLCYSTRFTFMIYLNKKIRDNKLICKIGVELLKYYITKHRVNDNEQIIIETYPNDRIQYEEKRKFLIISRTKLQNIDKELLSHKNKYFCIYNYNTSELYFYDKKEKYKYTLDLETYYNNYKSIFNVTLDKNTNVSNLYDLNTDKLISKNINYNNLLDPLSQTISIKNRIKSFITQPTNSSHTITTPYYNTNISYEYIDITNNKSSAKTNIDFSQDFVLFMPPRNFVNSETLINLVRNSIQSQNLIEELKKDLNLLSINDLTTKYNSFFNTNVTILNNYNNPFYNPYFDELNDNEIDYSMFQNSNITNETIQSSYIAYKFIDLNKQQSCITMLPDNYIGFDGMDSYVKYREPSTNKTLVGRFMDKNSDVGKLNKEFMNSKYKYLYDYLTSGNYSTLDDDIEKFGVYNAEVKDYILNIGLNKPYLYEFDYNDFTYKVSNTFNSNLLVNANLFGLDTGNIPLLVCKYLYSSFNENLLYKINSTNVNNNIIDKSTAIDNIIKELIKNYLPNNLIISVNEWNSYFSLNNSNETIQEVYKIFTPEEWYDIGQQFFLVSNNNNNNNDNSEVDVLFSQIIKISNQFLFIKNNDLQKYNPTANYSFINIPADVYKKLPYYCKKFITLILGSLECHNTSSIPYRDKNSSRWNIATNILDSFAILAVSIALIIIFPPTSPLLITLAVTGMILSVSIITIALIQLLLPFSQTQKLSKLMKGLSLLTLVIGVVTLSFQGITELTNICNFTLNCINYSIKTIDLISNTIDYFLEKDLEANKSSIEKELDEEYKKINDFNKSNEFLAYGITFKPLNMDLKLNNLDLANNIDIPYQTQEETLEYNDNYLSNFYINPFE